MQDPLTTLGNRRMFEDRLRQATATVDRRGGSIAVLLLDLDRFKEVNDSLGHDVGDALLIGVATRLRSCIRDGDTACRLGGDEFALVLTSLDRPDDDEAIAKRVLQSFTEPFRLAGHLVHMSPSMGLIVCVL